MFYTISSLAPIIISSIATYFIFINYDKIKILENFALYFLLIWIFLFLFKFFLLGPYSPINFYDNADIGLSRILFEKNHHLGGEYMHGILGGQDFYSSQLFGGQIISLEKIIFSNLPLWVALLIHKSLLLLIGFLGAYLLFFRAYSFDKVDVIFLASFITVFNPYTITSTIHQGLSFSTIPLAIYLFLYNTEDKYYFLKVICLSLLISISTAPLHSFLAILGGIVMSILIKKPKFFTKYLFSILILLFAIISNWHESIFAMYEMGPSSNRVFSAHNYFPILGSLGWLIEKTELCFITCKIQYSPTAILFFLCFLLLLYNKKFKYLFTLLLINYLPNIGIIIINLFNISILKSLNLFNYSYYLIIPISYYILNTIREFSNGIRYKKLSVIFLFFSITYLMYYNFFYFKKIFTENQNKVTSVNNLINRDWEPKNKLYRIASTDPWNYFHPNFMWAYGIDTIDGYVNLVDLNFAKFWHHGLKKIKVSTSKEIYYSGSFTITDTLKQKEFLDLSEEVDLNLLKLTNTGYIASYTPVKTKELVLVSGNEEQNFLKRNKNNNSKKNLNFYYDKIVYLSKFIKKPKDILIYEIQDYSDRFYFPNKIKKLNKNFDIFKTYRFISENYEKNISYSQEQEIKPGEGKILKVKKIKNGYRIMVDVKKEGIMSLNSFFHPFWKVYINNKEQEVINLANVHMGVELDIGLIEVQFIYDRMLLRDKIYEYLKTNF